MRLNSNENTAFKSYKQEYLDTRYIRKEIPEHLHFEMAKVQSTKVTNDLITVTSLQTIGKITAKFFLLELQRGSRATE